MSRRPEEPTDASRAARRTTASLAKAHDLAWEAEKATRRAARKHGTPEAAADYRTAQAATRSAARWIAKAQEDCARTARAAANGEDQVPPDGEPPKLPFCPISPKKGV